MLGRLKARLHRTQPAKFGLSEPGTAAIVNILKLLPARLRELYSRKVCPKEPDQEALSKIKRWLLVKEVEDPPLIQEAITQRI